MKKTKQSIPSLPVVRLNPSIQTGLSEAEVVNQNDLGLNNTVQSSITKSNWAIVKDYVLTLFNLYHLLIAVALVIVESMRSLVFVLVVVANLTIGIVKEIQGRKVVNRLSLLAAQKATVLRNGKKEEIAVSSLVLDDIILLSAGQQIGADSIVLDGELEVNESLLTGESDTIIKKAGDKLFSGSFVISGKAAAKVNKVGEQGFAAKIAKEAKKDRALNSELINAMRKVTKIMGIVVIPIAIALFVQVMFFQDALGIDNAVIVTAAALLGMLPRGLFLLISIALQGGVVRLAKKNVLCQDLYVVEELAHADILCLDKTGTITEGKMKVSGFLKNENAVLPFSPEQLLSAFITNTDDTNATSEALKEYFANSVVETVGAGIDRPQETKQNMLANNGRSMPAPTNNFAQSTYPHTQQHLSTLNKTPFSSARKWSSITFSHGTVFIGAAEKLIPHHKGGLPHHLAILQKSTQRVIFAAYSKDSPKDNELPSSLTVFAGITIADPLRKDAKKTLDFFKQEGVAVKIISGDNPIAVSTVAKEAGLEDWDKAIDMSTIISKEELVKAAQTYSIFGRVSPEQKQQLVIAFKIQNKKVAFVGDGVNDVLALRESDCSIALASGSSAAKQAARVCLVTSDFTALPQVVAEGRRVICNVTRGGSIFLVKTLYAILLSILLIVLNEPFPFSPILITLIDLAIEGFPSLFLAFEKNTEKPQGSFINSALTRALPHAIMIIVSISVLFIVRAATSIPMYDIMLLMYICLGFFHGAAVLRACYPPNKFRAIIGSISFIGFFLAIFVLSFVTQQIFGALFPNMSFDGNFLEIYHFPWNLIWIPLVIIAVGIPALFGLTKLFGKTLPIFNFLEKRKIKK
ncbi:MAG: cation-translocating P-type ATPase [Firmicutes bacterium]|nr:cation-translocating P-type ATPase [Bacillota bacterium]